MLRKLREIAAGLGKTARAALEFCRDVAAMDLAPRGRNDAKAPALARDAPFVIDCAEARRADQQVVYARPAGAPESKGPDGSTGVFLVGEADYGMALFRDLHGRPAACPPLDRGLFTPDVLSLAHAVLEQQRPPDGVLDPVRLAILADALEEAGCNNAQALAHLRSPGPHFRGCWAVNLILGEG